MVEAVARRRRWAAAYLLLQALATAAWWLWLWQVPAARRSFLPAADWPEAALLAFALPDLVLLVGGGALAARGLGRGAPWARPAAALVAGGAAYAALWCLAATALAGGSALASGLMLAAAAGSAVAYRWSR